MNEISVFRIRDTVSRLCIKANKLLPECIQKAMCDMKHKETSALGCSILCDLERNLTAAKQLDIPICQDTGMAVVFLEIGQDVHFVDGDLYEAVNQGVAMGYTDGLLRKSVVGDPLKRINTNDNTPAVIHTSIVPGKAVRVTVAPKGFGSENMSGIRMLTPFHGYDGVIEAVLEIVKNAGSNPCPPMVVGVGIGGDFEQCAYLSKKALCRDIDVPNGDEFYAGMERELLKRINQLGIGPQGFGGDTTALAVNIETAPTHIAGLPVAVNIGCHVTRHATEMVE
ncbi:MAG: fumarate hydratase [Ruminococcaceae bacterium]|nr:fumarate hydratase [Oscillospiraceae bacterium]